MASTAKEGASPSPGRRPGRGAKNQKEESEEELPKTEVQIMVQEYAARVTHQLNEEYGVVSPSATAEGQNPDPLARNEKKKAVFNPELVKQTIAYTYHDNALDYPAFNDNIMFQKLKNRLLQFFIEAEKVKKFGKSEGILKSEEKTGFSWEYRIELHLCLKRLVNRVINTNNKEQQAEYLKDTYFWFFKKLMAMGVLSFKETQEENKVMNPLVDRMSNAMRDIIAQKVTSALTDDEQYNNLAKQMFENGERTEHKDIDPAPFRLRGYARRNLNMGALGEKIGKIDEKDQALLKAKRIAEASSPEKKPTRGIASAVLGQVFDVIQPGDLQDGDSSSQAPTETTKASSSMPKEVQFAHTEGAVRKLPFKTFYTTGDEVLYDTVNKFEGRSNYQHYYPTGEATEQKLEQMWFYAKNKQLADKRRDEETKQFLKQWSQARGRFEAEVQRRKEHINFATNFAEARGFVRKNWKSKNFNPNDDPTVLSSTDEESDYGDEEQDKVIDSPREVDERSGDDIDKSVDYEMDGESPSPNRFRGMDSISKLKKTLGTRGSDFRSEIVDLTVQNESNSFASTRMSVDQQLATLRAIQDYNASLPKAKRKKDSLPEIPTHGITATHVMRRNKKKEIEQHTKYHAVGIAEGYLDHTSQNSDMFSLSAKKHALQRASSQQKIDNIRMHYGKFIGATPAIAKEQEEKVQHPFTAEGYNMSLSVYNKPSLMSTRRPKTADTQHALLAHIPGYKPPANPAIGADGQPEAIPEVAEPKEPILPEIKGYHIPSAAKLKEEPPAPLSEFEMISKDANDASRQRDMNEVLGMNDSNILNGIHVSMYTLKKAILMPQESQGLALGRDKYPGAGFGLVETPDFLKTKKKGKKGKKKGKKR